MRLFVGRYMINLCVCVFVVECLRVLFVCCVVFLRVPVCDCVSCLCGPLWPCLGVYDMCLCCTVVRRSVSFSVYGRVCLFIFIWCVGVCACGSCLSVRVLVCLCLSVFSSACVSSSLMSVRV